MGSGDRSLPGRSRVGRPKGQTTRGKNGLREVELKLSSDKKSFRRLDFYDKSGRSLLSRCRVKTAKNKGPRGDWGKERRRTG